MITRTRHLLATIVTLIVGSASAFGDTVDLVPVDNDLHVRDLANLADAVGIKFKIFDYEMIEPHCIHFVVEEVESTGSRISHDGSGICGLAGLHRLTVQWKPEADTLTFRFMRYGRDTEMGASVSGPTLEIPGSSAFSLRGIEPPKLQYGHETLLIDGNYGWNQGPQVTFKVFAELRPNPNSVIGTE